LLNPERVRDSGFLLGVKMNCERLMKVFTKRNFNYVRNIFLCLPVILLSSFLLFSWSVFAANYCATAGKDGTGPPSGTINTYYPGTASVAIGATSIPVGSSSGSPTAIAAGDLLLVIQMQDANINYSNNNNYGSGAGTGRGYTNLNQAGLYEYAVATGPVAGGFVPIAQGLTNSYRYRAAAATNGQSTYQVIRVPQYSSATVSSSVYPLNWNGSVGGVVAMDVAGTLTINNTITAAGAGFRGGYGRSLAGGAGANTDYLTSYTVNDNASKAEGVAGTQYYMNRPATFDGAPVQVTGGSGYPNGTNTNYSYARGAPGNAGGGGTDGNQASNSQNSGGGGGGSYANGGQGGNTWSSNLARGGIGGIGLPAVLAYNRVFMGGGGGAGTTNNASADNATYANPPGLACSAGAGACSSGAPGGGIILLRANNIAGSSTISANGGSAYNTQADSAGGGGAAGSVVLYSATGGSATVYTNGGNGGNAWRSQAPGGTPGDRHGPGGGGSGGFIAYSTGLGMTTQYNAGICGKTTTANDPYGATDSSGGSAASYSANPPGTLPGASCLAVLTIVKSANPTPSVTSGQVITYTMIVTNTSDGRATNSIVTDPVPTYTTYVANSTRLNGITVAGDGATSPMIAGLLIDNNNSRTPGAAATGVMPAGATATITFQVTVY
jgi:uncharacterized repeat protein (TIGR01451 family)